MRLKTALATALVGFPMMAANAAVVDPNEPPATPAGGNPEAGIGGAAAAGIAIGVGVIIGIAAGGGDDNNATATATATGTGP